MQRNFLANIIKSLFLMDDKMSKIKLVLWMATKHSGMSHLRLSRMDLHTNGTEHDKIEHFCRLTVHKSRVVSHKRVVKQIIVILLLAFYCTLFFFCIPLLTFFSLTHTREISMPFLMIKLIKFPIDLSQVSQ